MKILANRIPYKIYCQADNCHEQVYPLLRNDNGEFEMECISPIHGRSFVVGRAENGRYIVSKGNGLSYSSSVYSSLSLERSESMWGLLKKENARRDFVIGMEVSKTGIRTNNMEYVIELDKKLPYDETHVIIPYLLQYDVLCPYRITDYHFMPIDVRDRAIKTWEQLNEYQFRSKHMIAAYTLIKNLYVLRKNGILHNSLHAQNYTWALELLDFESSRSPSYPYENEEYESWAKVLADVEIVQTYEVINYISWCLKENVDYHEIAKIFKHFNLMNL